MTTNGTPEKSSDCLPRVREIFKSSEEKVQHLEMKELSRSGELGDEVVAISGRLQNEDESQVPLPRLFCAYHIENAFFEKDLQELDSLRLTIPLDKSRPTCPRRFLSEKSALACSDEENDHYSTKTTHSRDGWVGRLIDENLCRWGLGKLRSLPWFRFLEYPEGGHMAAHTDGSNVHPATGERSIATMLVYLSTCDEGGETTLYRNNMRGKSRRSKTKVRQKKQHHHHQQQQQQQTSVSKPIIESIRPVWNTVIIFPHVWEHSGDAVKSQPKIALRVDLTWA